MTKKQIMLLFLAFVVFMFPTIVNAQRFYPEGTDLSIWIDDTEWYVFTRDNIYNNSELNELGITYDYLSDFMYNNYVYLDGALFYSDSDDSLELLIRKTKMNEMKNLSNYSDNEVMKVAEGLAERQNAQIYNVYKSDYKYAYLKYIDKGLYLVEYFTVVNGEGYTITVQKPSQFTSDELNEIEIIVNSIKFDVDESLKEPSNNSSSLWEKFITGTITAAIMGGISALINKSKKKEEVDEENVEKITINEVDTNLKTNKDSKFKNFIKKIGILILSFVSAEMLLMIVVGESIDGTNALLLVLIVTIILYFLYNYLFRKKK